MRSISSPEILLVNHIIKRKKVESRYDTVAKFSLYSLDCFQFSVHIAIWYVY